jgi:hypothetical protein
MSARGPKKMDLKAGGSLGLVEFGQKRIELFLAKKAMVVGT